MTQELELPTPPEGHFWRVHVLPKKDAYADDEVEAQLRKRRFGLPSHLVLKQRWTAASHYGITLQAAAHSAAESTLSEYYAQQEERGARDAIRWGDYS